MTKERIYVLGGIRWGYTQSGHTELTAEEALLQALERVGQPDEWIFRSLSSAYHSDPRLKEDPPPDIASVVFVNLSLAGTDIPHELQYVKKYLPCAIFVLYASDEDFRRCLKELPDEDARNFQHYFRLRKPRGENDDDFDKAVRAILDEAVVAALRMKKKKGEFAARSGQVAVTVKVDRKRQEMRQPETPAPASPPLQRADLPIPKVADHELLRPIGQGSYGVVWLARNVVGTYRAVKVVYLKSFDTQRPYEREFAGIRKYEPISRTHDGLLDILQIGRNDEAGYFYYVMELADDAGACPAGPEPPTSLVNRLPAIRRAELEGAETVTDPDPPEPDSSTGPQLNPNTYQPRSLRSQVNQRGPLSVEESVRISLGIASALAHLHKHGLVHRDIKPSNIVFANGVPKLADIGLVTHTSEARSFVGTDGFIPPEGPGKAQADLYSLGKVIYEMCTGRDRQDFPELPKEIAEGKECPALFKLNQIILKACEDDASKRYQTAEELRADLARLQTSKSVGRDAPKPAELASTHVAEPKNYLYVSNLKVDLLFAQIPNKLRATLAAKLGAETAMLGPDAAPSGRDGARFSKLAVVKWYLEHTLSVGTVDEPVEYFSGTLNVFWGSFGLTDSFVYFGAETERTILGLGGAIANVIGGAGESAPMFDSVTGSLVADLCAAKRISELPQGRHADIILAGVARATRHLEGHAVRVEFLAKRLLSGALGERNVLLGTPVYVARRVIADG